MSKNLFLLTPPVEIMFDKFLETKNIFKFLLLDILNYKEIERYEKGWSYFSIFAKPLEDYSNLEIKNKEIVNIHFPIYSFFQEWKRKNTFKMKENKIYDCELHFRRKTRKTLEFTYLKVEERP